MFRNVVLNLIEDAFRRICPLAMLVERLRASSMFCIDRRTTDSVGMEEDFRTAPFASGFGSMEAAKNTMLMTV